MKKIIIALLSVSVILMPVQVAQASDQKVLAIIDTTINSKQIPSVIYEVCFAQSGADTSCPNGAGFMEGAGSANLQITPVGGSGIRHFDHGRVMTQTALLTSPDIKIVFVRIAHITSKGFFGVSNPESITKAVDWVSKNASKYSIDAVAISQSSTGSYLLRCTNDTVIINAVSQLNSQSIPVFAATGNNRLTDKVGFPSCVNGITGVGALAWSKNTKLPQDYTIISPSTNRGPGLDVVAQGEQKIGSADHTGTSIATAIAASIYVNTTTDKNINNFIGKFSKVLGYPYISK